MGTYKFIFPWCCPECGEHGRVYFNDGIDIWLVIDKITKNHSKASPECTIWWSYLKAGEQHIQDSVKTNAG